MKKGQVKGTEGQRGSSLKVQSPGSLAGLFGRTQGMAAPWQGCWPRATQHAARLGCTAQRGLPGAAVRGPAGSGPSLPGGASTGMASRRLQSLQGRAKVDSRLCYSCRAGHMCVHTHIPVQAVLHSITALSSTTWKKKASCSMLVTACFMQS